MVRGRPRQPRGSSLKKYRKHLIIPDCQVRPGVDVSHMTWIGNYIADKQPDVVVCLGDFADMESLSSHSLAGEKEGKRYQRDVSSAREAMAALLEPVTCMKRVPQLHLTLGNHEDRIRRTVANNPHLEGAIGIGDLGYQSEWKVHPFLKVVQIDGIDYAHFFTSGIMGRPCASAAAMLRERQRSCVQGHVQRFDIAVHPKSQQTAIMAGNCYLHDETYLTPQGNSTKRQIIVLHEVHQGRFDLMAVSLDYLKRNYS